jgi:uncharacterized protein
MRLQGRTAVVTGGSSGIGEATARALSRRGARVCLLGRNGERLDAVAAEIRSRGRIVDVFPVDLSDFRATTSVARAILARIGTPDLLVNNAGAGQWRPLLDTSPEEAAQAMAVPYLAAFTMTRAFLGPMLSRGTGHIVNVTSVASFLAWPGAAAYTAARRALEGFNAALCAEVRGTGIGVTLAVFGTVESPYWEHNPGSRAHLPKRAAALRALTPDATAEAIVRGVEKGRRLVVKPTIFRLLFLLNAVVPQRVEAMMCDRS